MLTFVGSAVSGFVGGSMKDSPKRFTCPKCGDAVIVWTSQRQRCPNLRCNAAFNILRARHKQLVLNEFKIRAGIENKSLKRAQKDAIKDSLNFEYPPVRIAREVKKVLIDFCAWKKKNGEIRNKQQEIISDAVMEFIQRSGFKIPK